MEIILFWFEFHLNLFPMIQINSDRALFQIMTRRRTGDKPLFEASHDCPVHRSRRHADRRTHCSVPCSRHGGTTEEGNCSYRLPRVAAAGSNGTNKGQIRKVPVNESARFLVYWRDVTRSQLRANTGILVCLVREIWQFKVFTGKEVTPLHEEGNS